MCSEYDVYGVSAVWALLLLALGVSWVFPNSGPLSSLWPSPQVGLSGISRDLKRAVQSTTRHIRLSSDSGRSYLWAGVCWGSCSRFSSSCRCSHCGRGWRWEATGERLTDADSARRECLRDVTLQRAARACGGCEGWLGGWRRRNLPDKQNMLPATSSAWSQLCVCHTESWNQKEALLSAYIIQPLKRHSRFSRVYLKTRPEHKWRSFVRRFICTLSLANGRWNWETPRLLSSPHQSLFFIGLVWRLLDGISGPARIIILESVFVGASTDTDICASSIHPVFSCYLFIVEYAEAAILSFWRRLRWCQFSASLSHPLPHFSISNVLFLPSLCYLTIRVSFFQLKPTPTDIPSVPPFFLLFCHLDLL